VSQVSGAGYQVPGVTKEKANLFGVPSGSISLFVAIRGYWGQPSLDWEEGAEGVSAFSFFDPRY
jgi:hypothetical protein